MKKVWATFCLMILFFGTTGLSLNCKGSDDDSSSSSTPGSGEGSGSGGPTCSGTLPTMTALQVWLQAGSLSEIDGSSISTWNDCDNVLLTADGLSGTEPTYSQTGGPGGGPSVTFDGANDFFVVDDAQVDFTSGITGFFVIKTPYTAEEALLDKGYTLADRWGFNTFWQTGPWYSYYYSLNSGGGSINSSPPQTGMENEWVIMSLTYDVPGNRFRVYTDGTYVGAGFAGGWLGAEGWDLTIGANRIGASTYNRFLTADVAETVLFGNYQSPTDRESLECYLSGKYSIAIGHGCP